MPVPVFGTQASVGSRPATPRRRTHLAILDGRDLDYVDRRDTPNGVRIESSIGRRGAPHATAAGEALLAENARLGIATEVYVLNLDSQREAVIKNATQAAVTPRPLAPSPARPPRS